MTQSIDRSRARIALGALAVLVVVAAIGIPAGVAQAEDGFEVEIVDAPDEIEAGEEISIEAEVTNNRSVNDSQDVTFSVGDEEVTTASTADLDPGETETIEFSYTTEAADAGDLELAVDTGDERDTHTVSVIGEPAFDVTATDGFSGSVSAGDEISVTAEVKNTGGDTGETDVSLRVGERVDSETLELEAGASEEIELSYSTDERDLGSIEPELLVGGNVATSESVVVGLPEAESFVAQRTAAGLLTVTLDASEVGENGSVPEQNVTIATEHGTEWRWDLSEDPENGMYQKVLAIPSEPSGETSLPDTTIEIGDTEHSDRVHLHTIEQASFDGWTEDGTLYLPVETVGIPDAEGTNVSLAVSGESLDAELVDANTVGVDLDTFRAATDSAGTIEIGFETDGARIGSAEAIAPEIRFLHGEIVLWHPDIENDVEYTVTVRDIAGTDTEVSVNETALRSGAVPVPDGSEIAGAENVTVSVSGVFENRTIDAPAESPVGSLNATLADGGTIRSDRSLERLAVSAVFIGSGSNATYLTDEFEIDDSRLRLAGTGFDENATVRLATDAGILSVNFREPDSGSLIGSQLAFVAGIVLIGVVTASGGGIAGRRYGIEDTKEAVGILFINLLLLAFLLANIFFVELPVDLWSEVVSGLLVTFGIGYAIGGVLLYSPKPEHGQSGTQTTATARRRIRVTDGTGPIGERVTIEAIREDGGSSKSATRTVDRGTDTLTLPVGTWTLQAKLETESRTYSSDRISGVQFLRRGENATVTLEIDLPDISVAVRDEVNGWDVPDASVRLKADSGETGTKRTDDNGRVTFDPPVGAETVTITVDHDKYEETTREHRLTEAGIHETVALSPRTGELRIVSTIDGVETGNMTVEIAPDEQSLKRIYGGGTATETTTDERGEFTHDNMLVGQYRAELSLPDRLEGLFETTEKRARVDQRGETVSLEASFIWELSRTQRDRIRKIREDLRDVTAKSGVDVVIPEYYASVVETVLDAVETFPQQGHHFAEVDAHPNEITDATLDAAGDAVATISEVMSTKRNLDLFTACSDMASANVRWDGSFETGTLVGRLQGDPMAARRAFAEQADSVSERIDDERGSLSEIAPAQEMLERVDIDDSKGGVGSIVSIHVAILLLDAIDELFDHRELRERLSRTVF
jgi:hypothetical protein